MKNVSITLRQAEKADMPAVLQLIKELAAFEKAPQEVTITLGQLEEDGFGDNPIFKVLLAEADKQVVGMALYHYSYSTWKGKCLYLEDLVVSEAWRGKGVGTILLQSLTDIARKEEAKRLHWQVLDWNEPAIKLYQKMGAIMEPEWVNCKLTEAQLRDKQLFEL